MMHNLNLTNQNPRWSASRFGSFTSCKTKYFLNYIASMVVEGRASELAVKGIAFHEIAEFMDSSKSLAGLTEHAKKLLVDFDFDQEKYPVIKSIPRFYMWWQEYIVPLEKKGFKVHKEQWENSSLDDAPVVGAVDLLLINEATKEAYIIDYKTSAHPRIAGYENQLLLYAYMIKNKLNTTFDKIKTYLFFPLANLKEEDISNEESIRTNMLKTYKELKFTENQVLDVVDNFVQIIRKSNSEKWAEFDLDKNASMGFYCSFCDFLGHPKYCPATYANGFKFPRKAKVLTKEEQRQKKKMES